MSGKGKEKVTDKGKRKWTPDEDNDKTRGKRKNRHVLQFFDDVACQFDDDEDDDADFSDSDIDGFEDEDFFSDLYAKDAPKNVPEAPVVPKEEVMSEDEFDRMMEDRYKPGSGCVKYAGDDAGFEDKRSVDGSSIYAPSAKDQPKIWKVKCTAGRERYTAFCLMQKYVEMEILGRKLPLVSAFSPDQLKGFILIEADKQGDIYEACKGITSIYPTRVTPVPSKEFSRMLCVRNKSSGISVGTWARVKNGKYKGDLASVVAVNDAKKKATVKLIPRIDLKAMAEKFGGGVAPKRAAIPPQRLISSSELDEFRPLIHSRRDRDTNEMVEVIDGMMLKDGYMYKKVSVDSLIIWGVVPTDDELLKFETSKKDESIDTQWLSQLFGEKRKEQAETVIRPDRRSGKSDGKSEGSTSASRGSDFESHDLVFFGRRDFGVVLGQEKDDSVKVITEGSDGPSVVTVKRSDLKTASFDKKLFFALDRNSHSVSINDIVRVLSGPLKERQGIVKKIYKGVLFLWDENEHENSGYICVKAQSCEKLNLSGKESNGKDSGPGFADHSSSPKSPLSPDNSFQEKSNKITFQQREDDGMFSVGQSLRIRVGPLKGYLCRVLAIRRSDVTVKLDSQQKILTVKAEHLSEVRERNSSISQGEETGKSLDFLGTQNDASDWAVGVPSSTEGNGWNAGGSSERSSWNNFDSSNSLILKEPGSADLVGDNAKKGTENSSWQIKASSESSSWGVAEAKQVTDQGTNGWGTSSSGWNQGTSSKAVDGEPDSWGKAAAIDTHVVKDNSWGAAAAEKQAGGAWNASGDGAAASSGSQWGKGGDMKKDDDNAKSWGKTDASNKSCVNTQKVIEDTPKEHNQTDGWNKVNPVGAADSEPSWNKKNDKSGWGKVEGESSGGKHDAGTSWGKPTEKSLDTQHSDFNKGSSKTDGWGSGPKSDVDNASGGGWNISKGSADKNIKSSGWGGDSAANEGSGNDGGGSWDNKVIKPNGVGGSWGSSAKFDGDNASGGCWNVSKDSVDKNIKSSGWGGASTVNEGSGNGGGGSWDSKVTKPNDSTNSSWKVDGNKQSSSDWSAKGDWGSVGGSGACKNVDGGSSAGWGKSNWGKSGASGDGNQEAGWSSKGNQSFGDNSNQDNSSGDRGRGGRWSGGRGDRGGFRGRGRSDFKGNQETTWSGKSNWSSGGGFGDNNNQDDSSSDRGRGGRWGGGHGGRGGYDQEGGFRGRGGGFRGRGRGDWNNSGGRGDSSNEDSKPYSWKPDSDQKFQGWKSSGGNSDGWKSGGGGNSDGWKSGGGGNSEGWKSGGGGNSEGWKSGGGGNSEGWKSGGGNSEGWKSRGGGGSWNQTINDNNNGPSNVSPNKVPSGSWGSAPAAGENSSGNWDKSEKNNEGPSSSWGKGPAPSSWGAGSGK